MHSSVLAIGHEEIRHGIWIGSDGDRTHDPSHNDHNRLRPILARYHTD